MKRGDTFLLPRWSEGKPHLYVVITTPEPTTNRAACVNITSRKQDSETTLILQPGDHPFIDRESVVWYGKAEILDLTLVEALVRMRTDRFICAMREPCSEQLLKRICEGLLESEDVEHRVKDYCRLQWGLT